MLVRGVKETHTPPKNLKAIPIALCSLPEIEGKEPIAKETHALDTGFGGMGLELTWKPSLRGLALIVLKGIIQAAKREKQ